MSDRLTKGISQSKELRFFTAEITKTAETGRQIHNLAPVEAVIFGKLLCAGLIFGADLKDKKFVVSLKTEFMDHDNYVLVTANNRGEVKGYPHLKLTEEFSLTGEDDDPVSLSRKIREKIIANLKDGIFTVIKDVGLKTPYNGSTKMITGEIARDITYYFTVSEQIPSIVGLSVVLDHDGSIKKGVGFLVQLMPEASDQIINILEKNMQRLPEIIDLLEMGMTIEKILSDMILKDIPFETTSETGARYHCDCSRERFEKGLILLSKEELQEIAQEEEVVRLQCHYCNKFYNFDAESMKKIIESSQKNHS